MLCPRCQNPLDAGAAFCGNCGLQVTEPIASQPPHQSEVGLTPPTEIPNPSLPPQDSATYSVAQVPQAGVATATHDHSGKAIASFVLGVLGLPACLIPILGIVFGILAIVFGTQALRSVRKTLAIIGVSLAVLVLLASLFFWIRNAQELAREHQAGKTFGAADSGRPLQAVSTPCYTTKIPVGMHVTQTSGSCTFLGIDTSSGEQEEVKVLQVPGLTTANLSAAAKADAANVVGAIPGGSIGKESTASFAGSQAYQIEIKSTDGSAGTISYVYDTTAQGNLVIVLHTQARATGANYDLSSIESHWAWL